jgi:exonuclease III
MHELFINIGIFRPDIVMITEVLPTNSETKTTKASIQINGFELFTNIEEEENIRGLALYIRNNLKVEEVKFNTISKENLWCTLKLKDNDKLLLGCIYRSPSTNNENTQSQ